MQLTDTLTVSLLRTTVEHIAALEHAGVRTVEDFILYLPRAHEDLSKIQLIADAPLDQKVTIRGMVSRIELTRLRGGKAIVKALFTDDNGDTLQAAWFNQPHVKRMLAEGDEVVFTGKIKEERYALTMASPRFEHAGQRPLVHTGRLVPIYPQHDILSTQWLREKMVLLRPVMCLLRESLPAEVVEEEHLLSRAQTVEAMHFPQSPQIVERARERLAFEEMFRIQREALTKRREWQRLRQERLKIPMSVSLIKAFFASLRFTPTGSQKIAIYEILKDMEKDCAMSRLLEGDVGSGKTLVATAVMANAILHGGQCALMVPTEVLARQHVRTIGRTLIQLHSFLQHNRQQGAPGVPALKLPVIALLTGSLTTAEAHAVRRAVAEGRVDLVIGTHALIQDSVEFADLKLVIVDEQHRFGVEQRARLQEKGTPHFLAMTATPIPRTLALTAYGHHDLSVLVEKPGHRRAIATKVVSPADRPMVERFIDQQIAGGRQVFVICPLIQESRVEEMAEVKSVEQELKRLQGSFPRRRIAALHGRMVPKEKERIMQAFQARQFDLLVSTAVIEVGIDVPNASIILIEGAERFGLSQLHQFRGRVGRGEHQSHCFLFTTSIQQSRSPRLRAMEEHESGFVLAEIDLKLRGPGELFGKRQSGFAVGLMERFMQPEFVVRARRAAERTMEKNDHAFAHA